MKSVSHHFTFFIPVHFIVILIIILLFADCSSTSRFNNDRKKTTRRSRPLDRSGSQVRVLIDQYSGECSFSFKSKMVLKNGNDEIASLDADEKFSVYTENDNLFLQLSRNSRKVKYLDIIPAANENNSFVYKGRISSGYLKISNSGTKINVVNVIDLEEYVRGVVLSELGTKFGGNELEAIKAFSICVRNYTLTKLNENKEVFDVYCDVRDQLYLGSIHAAPVMENAIQQTNGRVLKYNGELAVVFYHSSCGGYTEACSNVFSTSPKPYLEGVKDGDTPYCSISPNFEWTEEYTGKEITGLLEKAGYLDNNFYHITSIEIKDKFKSGRSGSLAVTTSDESGNVKNITIEGYSIRNVFKSKRTSGMLRSNFFEIVPVYSDGELEKLTITGKGYGHGVGFCQWGSIAQARAGKDYQEILSFYFPGTYLEDIK